jgi:hypothetical protein
MAITFTVATVTSARAVVLNLIGVLNADPLPEFVTHREFVFKDSKITDIRELLLEDSVKSQILDGDRMSMLGDLEFKNSWQTVYKLADVHNVCL